MNYVPYYKELKTVCDDCFFIGSNTSDGFKWADQNVFRESKLERLYIIKGAAGTGKSTLMKKIATACYDSGHNVQSFLCSSDPSSYDGVLIDGKFALVDGTAPHTTEMEYPGAISEIINLANFWDLKKLRSRKDEVIELSKKKRTLYERSYRALKSAKELTDWLFEVSVKTFDVEKASKAANCLVKKIKKDAEQTEKAKFVTKSLGMKGRIKLDTFKKKARTTIYVNDRFSLSYKFLEILENKLSSGGWRTNICTDPLFGNRISDIFVPSACLLITNDPDVSAEKVINMERFTDVQKMKEVKGTVKLSGKCAEQLFIEAENNLFEAGTAHFSLEKIYSEAMNFDALNEYSKLLTRNILNEI